MIDVSIATKGVEQALAQTGKGVKSIQKQTVGIIAKGYVKEIKRQITATGIKKRSGWLYKAYRYKVHKDGSARIYPQQKLFHDNKADNARAKNLAVAVTSTLNYGNTINVTKGWKNMKYLQISGKYYARPKRVTIKARNFLQKAEQIYIGGGRYTEDVEKMVDKQLSKYWGN